MCKVTTLQVGETKRGRIYVRVNRFYAILEVTK